MNRSVVALSFSLLLAALLLPVHAQDEDRDEIHVPRSSIENASDVGQFAHTNIRMLSHPSSFRSTFTGMTPTQIRSFYGLTSHYNQVAPDNTPVPAGHDVIAIVDAYHYANAVNDFNAFSLKFGLPQESGTKAVLEVVFASGSQPAGNTGWNQEAALDIEWAHAIAPDAKILLVEATDTSYDSLMAAVDVAVNTPGVKQVSMSWGGTEYSGQTAYDFHFNVPGPIFFAASGDSGGKTSYPAVSPYVVAVGGTSVKTDSSGNFLSESGWSGSGGGPSTVEPKPGWQQYVPDTGSKRCTPDLAADADPSTGVLVYGPTSASTTGWMIIGGTSVATPCVAAMVNLGGATYTTTLTGGVDAKGNPTSSTTVTFLMGIYGNLSSNDTISPTNFRDISGGRTRYYCVKGWDFVTGLGAPNGTGF
jgi:subtilase family serine protease